MIEADLPADAQGRVHFLPMRDFYDEARWVRAVQRSVEEHARSARPDVAQPRIALVGHFKDASSTYLAQFPNWQLLDFPRQNGTDATTVREALFGAAQGDAALQTTLAAHLPEAIAQWLLDWRARDAGGVYSDLQKEWQMLRDYRQSWASAPYAPTFVTVDAVVQWRDRVLLVERGELPGKGLYALPGGFLEVQDTLWQSCLRELREETTLALDEATWRQALRASRVFDHPQRSLRGRVITHVYHFDLSATPGMGGQPPRVQGADDARAAEWIALPAIAAMPERFFDDHFFILDSLLQLTGEI